MYSAPLQESKFFDFYLFLTKGMQIYLETPNNSNKLTDSFEIQLLCLYSILCTGLVTSHKIDDVTQQHVRAYPAGRAYRYQRAYRRNYSNAF